MTKIPFTMKQITKIPKRPHSSEGLYIFESCDKVNQMFKELDHLFRRFIYFEDSSFYTLSVIYVLLTYLYDVFDKIPYLQIFGSFASGKSLLGEIFEGLCFNSSKAGGMSDAVLWREMADAHHGITLIVDEADRINKTYSSTLLEVLRDGYHRNGKVKRVKNGRVEKLPTFCPKIIINEKGIQNEALESRTIPIHMLKANCSLEKFRFKKVEKEFKETKELIHSFLEDYRDNITERYNSDTPEISGRDEEVWAPILVIAETLDAADNKFLKESELVFIRESMLVLAKKIILQRKKTQSIGNLNAQILVGTQAYIDHAKPEKIDGGDFYVGEYLCTFIKSLWSIPGLRLETVSQILKHSGVLKDFKRHRCAAGQRMCYSLNKEKIEKLTDNGDDYGLS